MEVKSKPNHADLLSPHAQVVVTREFKSFIKPEHHQTRSSELKRIKVEDLVHKFQPASYDKSRILDEKDQLYLSENNPEVSCRLEKIRKCSKHAHLVARLGVVTGEARLKAKLLDRLEMAPGNFGQSNQKFQEKFGALLQKRNDEYVEKCSDKVSQLQKTIGLEFAGDLLARLRALDEPMVDALQNCEPGLEVEIPETYERAHILSDSLYMFAQDNRDSEDYGVSVLHFYRGTLSKDKAKLELKRLELEPKYESRNYIYKTKYFEQANLLVLLSRPGVDENTIITIYELFVSDKKVRMEPRHKILTKSEHVEFVRSEGVDYIAYTTDNYEKKTDLKMTLADLSDTLETPSVEPSTLEIPMQTLFYRPLHLDNSLMLVEGDMDELALFDVATKQFIAYYKEHKKSDYYNFFQACYAESSNLVFVLQNNQHGAVITSFTVDRDSKRLVHHEDYSFYEALGAAGLDPYINQYFTMQSNPLTNRLSLVDDDYQVLFTLRVNDLRKLEQDEDAKALGKFQVRDSSCWGHFVRLGADSFFMHYFPYESILRMYRLRG